MTAPPRLGEPGRIKLLSAVTGHSKNDGLSHKTVLPHKKLNVQTPETVVVQLQGGISQVQVRRFREEILHLVK